MESQDPGTSQVTRDHLINIQAAGGKIKERVFPVLKREGKTLPGDTRKACN